MHAIEKILAKNAGVPSVKTGEIVTAAADGAVAVHYAQEYLQKNPLA